MERGLKLTLVLVLAVLLVSACSYYQNPFAKKEKEQLGRGLKISFEKNTIPDVIYAGQEFPLSVLIENYGPQIDGSIKIFDQIEGDDIAYEEVINIPGGEFAEDNLGNIRGQIMPGRITVPRENKRVVYQEGNIFDGARANIHAELTLNNYQVNERFPLCVKDEKVVGVPCSNNEIETLADARVQYRPVTYSPITISKVEKTVTPLGNDEYFISLDITLSNVGGGEIIGDENDNTIQTPTVIFGNSGNLRCSPQNELLFVGDKAVFNCVGTTALNGQEYVERQTVIDYNFNYKMRIKKGPIPIVIKDK